MQNSILFHLYLYYLRQANIFVRMKCLMKENIDTTENTDFLNEYQLKGIRM